MSKKRVVMNSVLYTTSSLMLKAAGFLLLPVYTLFLTPEDYGITNLTGSFIQTACFVVAFSLYSSVMRFYTDYQKDRALLKRFFGSVIVFVGGSGIVFAIVVTAFRKTVIRWFFDGMSFYPIVAITLVTVIFLSLHMVHQNIMQGMQHGRKLTVINITVFILQAALNLVLIGVFSLGALGVLMSTMITNIVYFAFMLYDLNRNDLITICLDRKILREALSYSIPIMPHNLSTNIAGFASRVFINNSGTLSAVGLYGIAMQFGMLIDMVQSSVNKAFAPWFFNMMNEGKTMEEKDLAWHTEILELSKILITIYTILYMLIGLYSQEVIMIMTSRDSYLMAWTVIPILVVAFSVKSIYYFHINLLFYNKQATRKIFIATLTGSFIDIFLAYILVPYLGMYGAAVAFLTAKVVIVVIVVVMSKQYNIIGYNVKQMLRVVVPGLLFMGAGLILSYTRYLNYFSWLNLMFKTGVLLSYLLYIYFVNKELIKKMLSKWKW